MNCKPYTSGFLLYDSQLFNSAVSFFSASSWNRHAFLLSSRNSRNFVFKMLQPSKQNVIPRYSWVVELCEYSSYKK